MKRIAAASAQAASWLALGPSLVPRTWWMTAISVAVNAYGGQKAAEALAAFRRPRQLNRPVHSPAADVRRSSAVLALALTGSAIALSRSVREQADLSTRTGLHAESPAQHLVGYIAGGIGWLCLDALSIASCCAKHLLQIRLHRLLPFVPELVVGAAASAVIIYSWRQLITTAFARIARQAVLSDFARQSQAHRPTEPERTGSRYSREPFGTLGYHGRAFVWEGPRSSRIAEVTGRLSGKNRLTPAGEFPRTPIRVFIGTVGHPELADAASAAVAELDRAGAFERPYLLLAANTGSGWLPKWSISAFEYLTRGNCATAAVQYSFADSWLAFLIFREEAQLSSKYLLQAVSEHVRTLPADKRPQLYFTGESLGAVGGHGAFSSLADMRAQVAGALWTGTPRTTAIPQQLYRSRHYLSTELRPLIGRGSAVRFVQKPKHLKEHPLIGPYAGWDGARIVYAQHSSDPVVWWEPGLLLRKPDWLKEPRGKDVSPHLNWLPWVTFWQLLADMPRSVQLPGGHGHNYHRETVHYWNEILDLHYTKKDCNRIGDAIAADLATAAGTQALAKPHPLAELPGASALAGALRTLRSILSNRPAR